MINLEALKRSKLQRVPYVHYLTQFDEFLIEALIDLNSKVNIMQPIFAKKLGLCICKTNWNAQKIDDSRLETFKMVIALLQVDDKDGKFRFFKETFLLPEMSINITF